MSKPSRSNRHLLRALVPSLALSSLASAVSFNWSNPDGGAMNVSTNWSPAGVPGSADTASIVTTPSLTGFMTLTLPVNQAIGSLVSGHFAQNTVEGPGVLTLQTGNLTLTDGVTEAPDETLNSLFVNAVIHGAAGLNISGPGAVRLGAANLYTGGTTITSGGVTATADSNFGASGTAITLNAGLIRAGSSFTTNRPITIGVNGAVFESFGDLSLNGVISGSGAVNVRRFTGGSVTLGGVNTYTGRTNIDDNATLNLAGRITSNDFVRLAGTLNLGSSTVGLASNAIGDSATIGGYGGRLNIYAGSTNQTETLGTLSLTSGTTTINLEANANAGIALNFSNFQRGSNATAFIRGRDLGNGPLAANRAILKFANTGGLNLVGGTGASGFDDPIIPFLFGNANTTGGVSQVSAVEAGFVTRTATGELRVINGSRYRTALVGGATDNVRISDVSISHVGSATMNSLLLRDTLNSSGPTGIAGTGTLNITSGAIGAVSDLSGEELFIDANINSGAAEVIVHLAPTSDGHTGLAINGNIQSTSGLTKSGAGELTLTGTGSTFATLTVNGGIINYTGNVAVGTPGALGAGTLPLVIDSGVTEGQYAGIRAMTPGSTFSRGIVVPPRNPYALVGTFGGYGTTFSGPIQVDGEYLNLLGDTEPEVLTFSGVISGGGGLREPNTAQPIAQYLRITGNNTYSGGTVIRAGRWEVGSNTALGTGKVYFTDEEADGSIHAFGGARTLSNPLVFRATPEFGGSNPLTFTGAVDLGSVARDILVTNTANTTLSGTVSRGGIVKVGAGRLVLTNSNTYNGQTVIVDGALRILHNNALGASTGLERQSTFIAGAGVLELANNISSNEWIYFGAEGMPISTSSPTGALRSVSGNNTLTGPIAYDNIGTVGVDAGSTLTLAGDTLDNTADLSARLRKVGPGLLNVKNVRLPTLTVDAGQVRVIPSGIPGGTSRVSSLSIAAGASLDLTNNALVLDYTTTTPLAAVQSMLLDGRILTSITTPGAGVGFAEANRLFTSFPANFAAQSVDSTTLLLIQTLDGDTNLDRNVNFDDLLKLAQNYNAAGRTWTDGDFDYNGTVNFDDLLALAQNYGGSVALTTEQLGSAFVADFALAMSLVPEPGTLAALGFAPLLARRRHSVR